MGSNIVEEKGSFLAGDLHKNGGIKFVFGIPAEPCTAVL